MNRVSTMYFGTRATLKRERREMVLQIVGGIFTSAALWCLLVAILV